MTLRAHEPVRAVLFDLDDIVVGLRASADLDDVRPASGARRAVQALRAAGFRVGVLADAGEPADAADPMAVRVAELLGPFDVWTGCAEHTAEARGAAVRDAADRLELDPHAVVLVGGATTDVTGAHDAGSGSILVTDGGTAPTGVESADVVVDSLVDAAALVLHGARG